MSLRADAQQGIRAALPALDDQSIPLEVRVIIAERIDEVSLVLEADPNIGGSGLIPALPWMPVSCGVAGDFDIGGVELGFGFDSLPRCESWRGQLSRAMAALATVLRQAGADDEAEGVEAGVARVATQDEATRTVVGTAADWWAEVPTPLKWALGLFTVAQVADIVGAVR